MIPVTKPYLPSRKALDKYIDGIYERSWLTNNGPLVQELTQRLEDYLGVENLLLVSNGTLALQVAYRALGISKSEQNTPVQAITTPFTFVATASSLKWDGLEPVFADIDLKTWCLDPANIEAAITSNTRAIVPVHVFGNACDVDAIDSIAERYRLKVIYDASHAFGVKFRGESLLKYGEAATLSFHATKLFHTAEGGAIVFKHKEDLERAKKMIAFGLARPDAIEELGINAKMNEFQAAIGLSVLDEISVNLAERSTVWDYYRNHLPKDVSVQVRSRLINNNYAYFPILMPDEDHVVNLLNKLSKHQIIARRYFHPSLDSVDLFGGRNDCAISNDVASRVLCLPLYGKLDQNSLQVIVNELQEAL